MNKKNFDTDIVIVGAGAAGLSAARALQAQNREFILLEGSHRIGGRAYTEFLKPDIPFDLGAHWIHSPEINPLFQFANESGVHLVEEDDDFMDAAYFEDGSWLPSESGKKVSDFYNDQFSKIEAIPDGADDQSVFDIIDNESRWAPYFYLFFGQDYCHDVDEVSARDSVAYSRDEGNDFAVSTGFGELAKRYWGDVPVSLNTAVREIDWSGDGVRLTTSAGTVTARKVILTVSNGVLLTNQINFIPKLPDWKLQAIADLPMGSCTRVCLELVGDELRSLPGDFTVRRGDDSPIHFRNRPFGYDYVEVTTGGRFSEWMEKSGEAFTVDFILQALADVAGEPVRKQSRRHIVTAWDRDAWTWGAYSSALPGCVDQRTALGKCLDEKLFFAGEAVIPQHYATVHGACISGQKAAADV